MSCCWALVCFLTGRPRKGSRIQLTKQAWDGGDGYELSARESDGSFRNDCHTLTVGEDEMPSTLSKYKRELRKHEKRQQASSQTSSESLSKQIVTASLDETERRLKEFLKGSDNAMTTSDSASDSSSCESLLNGKRLTSADQLIRRFETRIPVNVLVSYFNEYHASLKKAEEEKKKRNRDMDDVVEQLSNLSLYDELEHDAQQN